MLFYFFSFVPGYFGLRRDEKKVQDVPERQERWWNLDTNSKGLYYGLPLTGPAGTNCVQMKKNKRSWKSPELGRDNYRWKPLKQNSHIKTIWNSKELFLFPLLKLKALCCKNCYNVMLDFNKDFKTVHILSGFCLTFRNDTFHTYMKAQVPCKKWILPQIRLEFNYSDSEEKSIIVSLDLGYSDDWCRHSPWAVVNTETRCLFCRSNTSSIHRGKT